MTASELFETIKKKQSFLCVGLDSDIKKIPAHLLNEADPVFEFNKKIIDATAKFTIAYKPNIAFYESEGVKGWNALEKTVNYIKENHPDIFIIADAKRGDIGNTSAMYARAFLENMAFDSVTVAPYMGEDSVKPFLNYEGKWVILLALTSNKGAFDFQFIKDDIHQVPLYKHVIKTSCRWASVDQMMYVVGATKADMLAEIRTLIPDHFLLVPGVGAQGGSLEEVVKYGINKQCGLLVNSSRGIIFADSTENFHQVAGVEAEKIQRQMAQHLKENNLL